MFNLNFSHRGNRSGLRRFAKGHRALPPDLDGEPSIHDPQALALGWRGRREFLDAYSRRWNRKVHGLSGLPAPYFEAAIGRRGDHRRAGGTACWKATASPPWPTRSKMNVARVNNF